MLRENRGLALRVVMTGCLKHKFSASSISISTRQGFFFSTFYIISVMVHFMWQLGWDSVLIFCMFLWEGIFLKVKNDFKKYLIWKSNTYTHIHAERMRAFTCWSTPTPKNLPKPGLGQAGSLYLFFFPVLLWTVFYQLVAWLFCASTLMLTLHTFKWPASIIIQTDSLYLHTHWAALLKCPKPTCLGNRPTAGAALSHLYSPQFENAGLWKAFEVVASS